MKNRYTTPAYLLLLLLLACTPKVTEQAQTIDTGEMTQQEEVEETVTEGCATFKSIPNGDEIMQSYVIYRDFLKIGEYKESFDQWMNVYTNAPAADGRRWTVYGDGIKYYEYFLGKEKDSGKRDEIVRRIMELYDELGECYPEQKAYVSGRKAFDYYYKYPDLKTDFEKYEMFREAIDSKGMDVPVFVINPFSALLLNLHLEGIIPMEQARKYALLIPEIVEHNIKKGEDMKSWDIVNGFAPQLLERFEGIDGFYDCSYYEEKYYPEFEANIGDCESMLMVYSRMKHGKCLENDPKLTAIFEKLKEYECIDLTPAWQKTAGGRARKYLQDGEYRKAVTEYELASEEAEGLDNKAEYLLIVAKIYYAHIRDYPKSRSYALRAAKVKPNWGPPYLLVGKLYASSGPLCGPGRGFDSQVVTWPAIDKWIMARRIDPDVTAEANKLISTYSKFMPDKEDIFLRGMKAGDDFTVGCWIQETTKIRTSD